MSENDGNINGNKNSGNTTEPSFKKKVRNAILTVQLSHFKDLEKIFQHLEHYKAFRYILACKHDGPTDEHVHIYVQYENARTLDSRYLYGSHLEAALGSAQQCITYLKAEDTKHKLAGVNSEVIYEKGEPRLKGNLNTIADLKEIKNMDEVDPRHLNTWLKVKSNKISINSWHKKIKVIYLWGESGIGKSYSVMKELILNGESEFDEVKCINNFWHGIGGDEVSGVAVYDDFRDTDMPAKEFINFIDYNIHNLNYKGGSAKNKYHLIIITSVQNPEDIYKNLKGEPRKQWLRRLKILNLNELLPNHMKSFLGNHDDLYEIQ